ncbi:hypothetical protein [Janthinobacterium sp.]|uniref:hypothetical protein n=1 Tax=Janthinobacterium sp. TaxID=1871054 RepID=UPI00293D62B6|nr:hypothetical protein [Janthinobacterium sp.]
MSRARRRAWPLLWCALCACGGAAAQVAGGSVNLIDDGALSRGDGVMALNLSAGAGNAQTNLAVFGMADGALALRAASSQRSASAYQRARGMAVSEIGAGAFSGGDGLLALNQAAGDANTQANLVLVGIASVSELSAEQLGVAGIAPPPAPAAGTARRVPIAAIADTAFVGAHGIVQVNQLAGSGNSTANIFALSISFGAQ